ncbi:hypothetical protein FPZ52_12900 (plasmid) [Qingshengfaniella alkalisoli]|uniref:Uncharacterized protein n=1 Tax=Qingshengfaniella alkalisoli TaxID=2599296 RepID=A0A5B8J079_9RHOB|nr:hypothetical protein FPZ52_12900 [Qingshengfaniella alkalisoli]
MAWEPFTRNYQLKHMAQELWWYLPDTAKRVAASCKKRQAPKFDRDVSILFRPDDVGAPSPVRPTGKAI